MTTFEAITTKNEPLQDMTVSRCAKTIKQPRGGYIKRTDFEVTTFFDTIVQSELENLAPATVGMVVDYLTRLLVTRDKKKAFDIPFKGATNVDFFEKNAF